MKTRTMVTVVMLASGMAAPVTIEKADARGGLNASYARAYCEYYRNKIAIAARGQSQFGLGRLEVSDRASSQSAEYWRAKYREYLKEHGY